MTAEQRRGNYPAPAAPPSEAFQDLPSQDAGRQPNTDHNDQQLNSSSATHRRLTRTLSLLASPITDDTGNWRSVLAGLLSLFTVGTAIGLVTPKNPSLPSPWYQYVSAALGYVYFLAWSVSFYPQVVSNFQRRSTTGLSADFCVLNVLGFACYAAYNACFFWSTAIQEEYRKQHGPNAEITVQSNDVAFAIHALIFQREKRQNC